MCACICTSTQQNQGEDHLLTHREIAELSFRIALKTPRISSIPLWMMKAMASAMKKFNRHRGDLLAFLTTAMSVDAVAPAAGVHHLESHFRSLALRTQAEDRRGSTP